MDLRAPLLDAGFLAGITIPPDTQHGAMALRREMARLCRIPPEAIRPDDRQADLRRLISDWDLLDFVLVIEEALQKELPGEDFPQPFDLRCFCWKRAGPETFGEWTEKAMEWANQSMHLTGASRSPEAGRPRCPVR